jgi:hypothetical protein
VLEPDMVLIDRHTDGRKIAQRLGISVAARWLKPPQELALSYPGDAVFALC